jgi:hypothetical protein
MNKVYTVRRSLRHATVIITDVIATDQNIFSLPDSEGTSSSLRANSLRYHHYDTSVTFFPIDAYGISLNNNFIEIRQSYCRH